MLLNFVSNLCTDQRKLPKCPVRHYGIAQMNIYLCFLLAVCYGALYKASLGNPTFCLQSVADSGEAVGVDAPLLA